MGRFIEVTVEADRLPAEKRGEIVAACPVAIFTLTDQGLPAVISGNEDECILCGRCIELAPEAITVRRLYGAEAELGASGSEVPER